MPATYDRDDNRPDPARVGLSNVVMDPNTLAHILAASRREEYAGADPAFYAFDPMTACDLTDFLRNPQRGGKQSGRIKLITRQILFTFDANHQLQVLNQQVNLAGGDNVVILQALASANNASSTVHNINLFDFELKDSQQFTLQPRSPLNLFASSDSGLPAKNLPAPWRGTNSRQASCWNRTGTSPAGADVINVYVNLLVAQVDTME